MRLTNTDRERICLAAVAARFDPLDEALAHEEHAIADRVYRSSIPVEEEAFAAGLPAHWHKTEGRIYVNVAGQRHWLEFRAKRIIPPALDWVVEDGPLAATVHQFALKRESRKALRKEAHRAVRAMLDSIASLKALETNWPEGKEFYQFLYQAKGAPLPAVPVQTVNSILGLSK